MKSLKGSQTEKNILVAFSGESQARNRYNFFAKRAFEMAMSLSARFLTRQRIRKSSMQKDFLNFSKAASCRFLEHSPLE